MKKDIKKKEIFFFFAFFFKFFSDITLLVLGGWEKSGRRDKKYLNLSQFERVRIMEEREREKERLYMHINDDKLTLHHTQLRIERDKWRLLYKNANILIQLYDYLSLSQDFYTLLREIIL